MFYFNDAQQHHNMKHINIEALNPGPGSAYSVKFEFDQPVKVNREYEQESSMHEYLRKNR